MLSLFLRTQEGFITFKFYLVRLEHLLEMSVISEANIYAEVKKYKQMRLELRIMAVQEQE